MESPILNRIAEFLQEQKTHKRWRVVFVIMAVFVGVGTVTGLRMMGLAMTHKERVLDCQLELHKHDKSCYDSDKNLICGYADYVVHKHNDDCYNADLKLVCKLPEIEKHEHTKDCYNRVAVLVCGQEESPGHEHTDACYTTQKGALKCKKTEHTHTDECYDEEGNLTCGMEEHQHDDDCYKWEDVLTCGHKEGEGGHEHTDQCYEIQEGLTCGKLELHTHTDKCFEKIDKNGKNEPENLRLICGKVQLEEHVHTEAAGCLKTVEVDPDAEIAQTPEDGEDAADTSSDGSEVFTTDLSGEGTDGEAAEGEDGKDGEGTEGEDGENPDGEAADGEGTEDGAAEEDAGTDEETDGEAIDAEPEDYEFSKTYEGLGYIITAAYNEDANIPEEAKLVAEQITEESDKENYKTHEEEFKKNMGEEEATLSALFKIGFYVDGEEVEPESPVLVTIQFVDKNGLPEGAPVKVVHFGDEGTEVIDGSNASGGSTSFRTNGFSIFGVGVSKEADAEGTSDSEHIQVSESYEYKSDAFDITFHIEGEASFLKDEEKGNSDSSDEGKEGEEISSDSENNGEGSDKESQKEENDKESQEEDSNEVSATVENEKSKFDFDVKVLDEDSEEYKEFAAYADNLDKKSELFLVEPISYSMTYDGRELDLSDCEVNAELTPKKELDTFARSAISELTSEDDKKGEEISEGKDNPIQIDLAVVESAENGMNEIAATTYWNEDIADEEETVENKESGESEETEENKGLTFKTASAVFAVAASGTAYPQFTVQYYANLDTLVTADNDDWCTPEKISSWEYYYKTRNLKALSLIDTSKKSGYGKVPDHGVDYLTWSDGDNKGLKNLELSSDGRVKTEKKLTEVYLSKEFDFNKAPNINYFDALDQNNNYKLVEIWILKEGKDPQSTEKADWDVVNYTEDIGFTNRKETSENNSNYIWIDDGTVMRLVYDTNSDNNAFSAMFYDYDISNGTTTSGGVSKMNTYQNGIHSNLELNSEGQYAFGNKNCGTAFGDSVWRSNSLNANNANHGYLGCTFKLVTGVTANNEPIFNEGITAPHIFGSQSETGKTSYPANLTFNRNGDTYTLTSANGTYVSASNLDCFEHPGAYDHILTNSFWPLDGVPENMRKDMLLGKAGQQSNQLGGQKLNVQLPASDDGKDHNCFFGMYYEVEFDLSEEYIGPLEYLFYGDDDMWVFLDGQLVCDIGGVHSSVGEYVDLWDYLGTTDANGNTVVKDGKAGTHTLKFFYTERGASGSSCWMQFTLPSVTSRDTDPASGRLTNSLIVSKTVDSDNYAGIDLKKEYTFEINFKKINEEIATPLLNNYGYKKYRMIREFDSDGNPVIENGKPVYKTEEKDGETVIKTEVVLENGLIADGETFTLADSEYIVIDYLPENTTYTIKEVRDKDNPNYSINTTVDGKQQEGNSSGTVQDEIDSKVESDVKYVNDFSYELPETGGSGIMIYTIAGALCIMLGAGFMYRKKAKERRV